MDREKLLIVLSFVTIYIVWGSTYLFSAFVLEQIEPFLICAIRFITAGILCFGLLLIMASKPRPTREEVKNSLIAGFIFLGLGTGGAIWSLNYLDSGFSALIISGEPLIIVIMLWLYKQTKPAPQTLFGIALGIAGMFILVCQNEIVTGREQLFGILAIFGSMLAWGMGSIFVSGARFPNNQIYNIGLQLIVGGVAGLIFSFVFMEDGFVLSNLTMKTILSMVFLILFGSIGAFTAFNYLLKKVSTEKVVTNTYVNPVIAMILGYLFNNELITWQSVIAAVIMLFGVFLINSRKVLK